MRGCWSRPICSGTSLVLGAFAHAVCTASSHARFSLLSWCRVKSCSDYVGISCHCTRGGLFCCIPRYCPLYSVVTQLNLRKIATLCRAKSLLRHAPTLLCSCNRRYSAYEHQVGPCKDLRTTCAVLGSCMSRGRGTNHQVTGGITSLAVDAA